MLGFWRPHLSYQKLVVQNLSILSRFDTSLIFEYKTELSKLWILDLDPLQPIIAPLYSNTGRASKSQPEIFRSLILMIHLGYTLDEWIPKLKANFVLRTACGFFDKLPATASYYDFINRIIKLDDTPRFKKKKRKPTKKIGKGKKLPHKRPSIVGRLVNKIMDGRRFNKRPELILQQIFAQVCVRKSVDLGLIPKTVSISGDGTCMETGASSFGFKTCGCKNNGIFNCDCPRKFSDPNATWGWDSHNERYFYGYTGYFISTYNPDVKLDLPLYLRLVAASRHDSVSAVVAIAEFRDLYPNLKVDCFIHDSAADNYATYELLDYWNISAVIPLNSNNKGNFKYPTYLCLDEHGTPICPGGRKMIYWGKNPGRKRIKFRCPRVLGKAKPCEACATCSTSAYGRTIYTKPDWDLRLFTTIPRGSSQWKNKMKERTAAERVNNRILNNYGIGKLRSRGKKRISFFTTIAGINIHLDAQLAELKYNNLFDFAAVFNISEAA